MMEGFPPIQKRLMEFIRRELRPGYNHYNVSKLIGDASARQYFRYTSDARQSFILAAYPEAFDPEHFPYQQIYSLLKEIGLPVAEIFALDGPLGIVLQEDLGDETLQKHFLDATHGRRQELLNRAIDSLIRLQQEGSSRFGPQYDAFGLAFDEEKLNWELGFFARHYLHNYRRLPVAGEAALLEEFGRLAAELAGARRVLCHRDYHIRNLMLKDGRLYMIDFQDARWGPTSYDLVSLLKDSIELGGEEIDRHIEYFLAHSRLTESPEAFSRRQFDLMSVQRLLKALGTYAYQVVVRENFIYEQYMAGSLHRVLLSLQAMPEFPCLQSVVESELNR
ncbi:MAG: aminoglycoside phosphotransferase family protein [Acidobacteriota bacterium]